MFQPLPRVLGRALAGLGLATGFLLATAGAATAHDSLIDSTPAVDQQLDTAPAEVRLTFSADVMDVGAAIRVIDDEDTDWTAGEPVLAGPVVTVPLDPRLPDGAYRAAWRVVSSDGHAISGVVPFVVGEPVAAADPVATEDTRAVDDLLDPAGRDAPMPGRTVVVAALGALVAGGLYALVLALRARRRRHSS